MPSPEQLRVLALVLPPVAAVLAIGAGTPLLLEAALPRFGVRGVAMPLLALAALSLVLPGRRLAGSLGPGAFPALGIPVLLLGAAATGQAAWLRLAPALVYLALAGVFLAVAVRHVEMSRRVAPDVVLALFVFWERQPKREMPWP